MVVTTLTAGTSSSALHAHCLHLLFPITHVNWEPEGWELAVLLDELHLPVYLKLQAGRQGGRVTRSC